MLTLLTNMPREELIAQLYDGLVLMVLGMGTVFLFLVILIYASKLMSRICMNLDKNHPPRRPAHLRRRLQHQSSRRWHRLRQRMMHRSRQLSQLHGINRRIKGERFR